MTRVKQMNLMDAALLGMETAETLIHLGGAAIFRVPDGAGPDYVRQLYNKWRRHAVDRPPFNYRLSSTWLSKIRPTWEILDDVDLGQHLFHVRLPYPGGDHELSELVGQLHSVQLNRTRPLWEIYLIEGLSERRFAMYTKVHHALVDGASAMRIFGGQFSPDAREVDAPPVWAARPPAKQKRKKTPDGSETGLPRLAQTVSDGYKALRQLYSSMGDLGSLAINFKELAPPSFGAPDTIFNRPITARRATGVISLPFSHVRGLSKTAGCTINDIVLAVCGGALRRYLQQLGELPKTSVVCTVPVALNKEGNAEGGNTVSAIPVALGTDVARVDARFDAVLASVAKGKAFVRRLPISAAKIYTALIVVPVLIEAAQGRRPLRNPLYNLIITNVPGTREPLYLNGAKMLQTMPVAMILRGMALNITVMSLQDQLSLSFTSCPDVAPNIERLGPLLAKSFEELEALITKRTGAKSAAKPKVRRSNAVASAKVSGAAKKAAARARKTSVTGAKRKAKHS